MLTAMKISTLHISDPILEEPIGDGLITLMEGQWSERSFNIIVWWSIHPYPYLCYRVSQQPLIYVMDKQWYAMQKE